jgi:mRNA interferase RelE/StbE
MNYEISILRRAQKELADVSNPDYQRIRDAILALSENPRPANCKKLVGREGWRIKVGSYRVIYEINDANEEITVLHIGHRRDIYR